MIVSNTDRGNLIDCKLERLFGAVTVITFEKLIFNLTYKLVQQVHAHTNAQVVPSPKHQQVHYTTLLFEL